MIPLKVHWKLVRPVQTSDYPIHLDALLAWAAVDIAREKGLDDPVSAQNILPLDKHTGDNGWCWKSSQLVALPVGGKFMIPMIRQMEYHQLSLKQGAAYDSKINTFTPGTGRWKAYDLRFSAQWIETMTAWCIGNIGEIEALLDRITHIGPRRRNDWGKVSEYSVSEDAEANQLWRLRNMPDEEPGYIPVSQCLHPPYWDRANMQTVFVPGN